MIEWLIKTSDPSTYVAANYRCLVMPQEGILNILHTENPVQGADILIGAWDRDGNPAAPILVEEYLAIRPLGNFAAQEELPAGKATPTVIGYHSFAGWMPRKLGDSNAADLTEALYPTAARPFVIEVRHREFTGEVNPEWNGWGWRAEIIGSAISRDPSARAIGIYSDANCTQYLYTTGAFTQGLSEWQVDGDNNPLVVWFTQYNPAYLGYPNDSPQDVHHAVLLGSAQEGYATLYSTADAVTHAYWENIQGAVGAAWVDTGATVTQLVGAGVYRVSINLTGQLTPGQQIKLGAQETTFTGFWSGFGDYLLISPHVTASVGAVVWKWA